MKLFFPEGLCCAECQTLEEEEVGFCPFLRSTLLCQSNGFGPPVPWLLSYYALDNAFFAVFHQLPSFPSPVDALPQYADFVLTQTVSVEKCFFRYVCSVTCVLNSGGLTAHALEAKFPDRVNIALEAGHGEGQQHHRWLLRCSWPKGWFFLPAFLM